MAMKDAVREAERTDWVMVENPDLKGAPAARVPRESFELSLEEKGFRIVVEDKATGGKISKEIEVVLGEGENVVPIDKGKDK